MKTRLIPTAAEYKSFAEGTGYENNKGMVEFARRGLEMPWKSVDHKASENVVTLHLKKEVVAGLEEKGASHIEAIAYVVSLDNSIRNGAGSLPGFPTDRIIYGAASMEYDMDKLYAGLRKYRNLMAVWNRSLI
jgi:hypothetical protein